VSAHVVQKAPASSATPAAPANSSLPSDDEDEKTTIESGGWEEEASTTVEQGEIADKLRALGVNEQVRRQTTNITSTHGTGIEEPTVDDPRAAAAIALLPPPSVARLMITQGNDAGQALDVRPGKTYTIGRAIDNDPRAHRHRGVAQALRHPHRSRHVGCSPIAARATAR